MNHASQLRTRALTRSALLHAVTATLALLAAVTPALAQHTLPANTPPRQLPPGGIPQRVFAPVNPIPASVATFQQSFQVSLDGVHWYTSIRHFISCPAVASLTPLTAPCAPGTPPVAVYTRWTQIADSVDMTAAHQQYPSLVEPYKIVLAGSSPQLCTAGTIHMRESSGYPVSVTPSGQGGTMPIVCKWRVSGVGPYGAPARGQQRYMAYPSNVATVTLTRSRMGAP